MKEISKKFIVSRYWIVTILFIVAKLLIHFLTNTRYELLRDEMLFINMGERLSAGYATIPPVTEFLAFLINKVFGFLVFGIRFFPALMGTVSDYLIASIVREPGGGVTALCFATSSYLHAPGFLIINTLFTPNATEELMLVQYIKNLPEARRANIGGKKILTGNDTDFMAYSFESVKASASHTFCFPLKNDFKVSIRMFLFFFIN